jgi:hypothetical protein
MKRVLFILSFVSILLTGCFETTEEITLNEDGSGNMAVTSDLSAVISLAKNMGGGADGLDKLTEKNMDTTISLGLIADSMQGLSVSEKEVLKKGAMQIKIDGKNEKFFTKMSFPFSDPEQIASNNKQTAKVMGNRMKDLAAGSAAGIDDGNVPDISSFSDYYDIKFEKGEIKRTLNKEKYAKAESDEYLKGLKETAGMGIPVTATYIINLPRPVEKAEGKNVTLSEDKKKVTIKVDIDDFFSNPEKLEYKIKY